MTTKHNHAVIFGRKEDNCPRCQELRAGAKPVRWANARFTASRNAIEVANPHNCVTAKCGPVCTHGDW